MRFTASKKSEVDRSVFVHPEDAEIRTLFEELMMGLDQEQESDSEDEGDGPKEAATAKAWGAWGGWPRQVPEEPEKVKPEGLRMDPRALLCSGSEDEEEKAVPDGACRPPLHTSTVGQLQVLPDPRRHWQLPLQSP